MLFSTLNTTLGQTINKKQKIKILVTVDASTLQCSLCLDKFIDLCRMFEKNKKCDLIGIFQIKVDDKMLSIKKQQILKLKLKGLKKANGLNITFFIDNVQSFKGQNRLLIMSPKTLNVHNYSLPLNNNDICQIIKLIK